MKVVITVIGKDAVGIIARVSALLHEKNINILDISQTVFGDLFAMIMFADMSVTQTSVGELSDTLEALGDSMGLRIIVTHEAVFNSMHRI